MTKFAHLADCHLGGWRQEELQKLNFQSFQKILERCIQERVGFILISGDLFDSAYPPIEILKKTFGEFKRLKDARVPCFLIAGSHDYSVSGKTFLDVLEKAGFCKNVADFEEKEEMILLNPTIHEGVAIYGYPGKKSGMEINDLRKIKLQDAPGMFKIFVLHTTIDQAKGTLPIDALEIANIPKADYYALGHLHIDFQYENFVYPGPVFPNNFQELEDLKYGSFYLVDTEASEPLNKVILKIKEIEKFDIKINDAITATEKIVEELTQRDLQDKVILLRISGELENGKNSDIKFQQIEDFTKRKGAYFLLKNTHDLKTKELELEVEIQDTENIEEETIRRYSEENPSDFNKLIPQLMNAFSIDKQEDEKSVIFENRLMDSIKKVLKF